MSRKYKEKLFCLHQKFTPLNRSANVTNLKWLKMIVSNKHRFIMGGSMRSMLQFCQGEFDPTSDDSYFLFFQKVYTGDYTKYQRPKLLSASKRSSEVFKLTTKLKPLCLRYVVAQCSQCREYFSVFNTTKHYKTWETSDTPKISRKLLEKKGINDVH